MEQWKNRMYFWLALIGSAVGLGNIWRFPYLLAEGGGLFLILYFVALVVIGTPMLMLELRLAKKHKETIKKVFREAGKHIGKPLGKWYLLIVALFFIMGSYYAIVVAQTLQYGVGLHLPSAIFIVWAITIYGVFRGIKGIEKLNTYFMGLLLVLLIVVAAMTIKEVPNLLALPSNVSLAENIAIAVAQVLFSLSIGAGMTYTYATYAKKYVEWKTALVVVLSDLAIALMASMIVFSLPYSRGVFMAFGNLQTSLLAGGGPLLNGLFFLTLFAAGITSLLSIGKMMVDNSSKRFLLLQALMSGSLLVFGTPIIEFLDRSVVNTLFLVMLPVNAYVFYKMSR
ncbi:MAG: hypothetical protein D6769_02530 [Methanobacteriota archaeon]|nr:MAG: hypothetical protein D6769_02530 [Euryarchaeota archaeon]